MMRPVLTDPYQRRKQRKSSMGISTIFKSLAESFKSQSANSRHQKLPIIINPTVVGGTSDQQELFRKIASKSLEVRSQAVVDLTDSIEKFAISSIPEIWYAARDLLEMAEGHPTRIKCLNLLVSCIKHDDLTSSSIRIMYYKDIIGYCILDYEGPKLDADFSLFLRCLEELTQQGTEVYEFYLNETDSLKHFLNLSIAICFAEFVEDTAWEDTLARLIHFTKVSALDNKLVTQDASTVLLARQAIEAVLKAPSRKILELFLVLIDALILEGLALEVVPNLMRMLSTINSREHELSFRILRNIVQQNLYTETVIQSLCEIIGFDPAMSPEVTDGNVAASAGALNLLIHASKLSEISTVFDSSVYSALEHMESAALYGNSVVNTHILILLKEIVLHSRAPEYWSHASPPLAILHAVLASNTYDKNQKLLVNEIISALLVNHMMDDDALIPFMISHPKLMSEENTLQLLRSLQVPFTLNTSFNDAGSALSFISDMLSGWQAIPVQSECFNLVAAVHSSYIDHEGVSFIEKDFVKWFLTVLDTDQVKELDRFIGLYLSDICLIIEDRNILKNTLKRVVDFSITGKSTKVAETVTSSLCNAFVLAAFKSQDSLKTTLLFDTLTNYAKLALDKKLYTVVLIISKLLIRLRVTGAGHMVVTNPGDIEGLSAAFNRNYSDLKDVPITSDKLLWWYPEVIPYIPAKYVDVPCLVLKVLPIENWFSLALKVMAEFHEWELYSFIWSHFCPQLSNLDLFMSEPAAEVKKSAVLQSVTIICDHLSSRLPSSLKIPEGLTKADLQIAMFRTLTALIGYHSYFSKADEDHIIKSTVDGLSTSWEKTAIPAIHFLNLACYEIPLSVKKYLGLILIKLQTRISSFFASPHILEFLMALSHLPSLSSNFNVEEYKRIFGISFQFIEFCSMNRSKFKTSEEEQSIVQMTREKDIKMESIPSTELIDRSPALWQYLLRLSYSVISSWFLKMSVDERQELKPFIIRNLRLSTSDAENNQTIGFIDFISRFSLTDSDLTMTKNLRNDFGWKITRALYLDSVISIMTSASECKVHIRRPSDSIVWTAKLSRDDDALHLHENFTLDTVHKYIGTQIPLAEYVFPDSSVHFQVLPDTQAVKRSLDSLDRLPVVQFVKAGIIYIGHGQYKENEIFSNQFGSEEYQMFLCKIGQFIKLHNCNNIYMGGLDTENNIDGEFAVFWHDEITHLVFHTTTLMPYKAETDPNFSLKKRHVGNNFVNIYFDESGLPFDFNVIKSQFNFISIVISPVSKEYYRVKLYRKKGVPPVFAACHFKLISKTKLAVFVRNLTLVCSEFSDVWNSQGQFVDNWCRRSQQIKKLSQFIEQGS